MKLARWVSAAAFSLSICSLMLAGSISLHAQEERDEAKPAAPEARPETTPRQESPRPSDAKPAEQSEDKPTSRDEKNAKQTDKQNDAKPAQDDRKAENQSTREAAQSSARSSAQSSGQGSMDHRGGGRIPDDTFRANFGRQHTFVVQRPTTVEGQPRFQYGGYWFTLSDAWPVGWDYTDTCYIDYIDGEYFLFDLAHPGVRLAIVVVS